MARPSPHLRFQTGKATLGWALIGAFAACASSTKVEHPRPRPSAPTPAPTAAVAPAAAPAPAPPSPPKPEPPQPTWPAWSTGYRDTVHAVVDSRAALALVGERAVFLELSEGRWLCLYEGSESRCFAWPADLPRPSDPSSLPGLPKGGVTLGEGGVEHGLSTSLDNGALLLTHDSSRGGEGLASDCADVVSHRRDDVRPHRELWRRPRRLRLAPVPTESMPSLFAALRPIATKDDTEVTLTLQVYRHGEHYLTVVTEGTYGAHSYEIVNQLICIGSDGQPERCRSTSYQSVEPIEVDRTLPRGWLLSGFAGSGRSGGQWIAWLDATGLAHLGLGWQDGYGESCEQIGLPGYCVWVEGTCTPYKLVSPECIEIGPSIKWSAVHVRIQHRWLDTKSEPASPEDSHEPGTYHPSPSGWVRGDCPAR